MAVGICVCVRAHMCLSGYMCKSVGGEHKHASTWSALCTCADSAEPLLCVAVTEVQVPVSTRQEVGRLRAPLYLPSPSDPFERLLISPRPWSWRAPPRCPL